MTGVKGHGRQTAEPPAGTTDHRAQTAEPPAGATGGGRQTAEPPAGTMLGGRQMAEPPAGATGGGRQSAEPQAGITRQGRQLAEPGAGTGAAGGISAGGRTRAGPEPGTSGRTAAGHRRQRLLDDAVGPLFLAPALILLLLILVLPFGYMVWTSLTDLSFALPDRDGNFVGFDNFRRLMHDPIFWHSFLVTLWFVIGAVGLEFLLGFGLALLFRHQLRRQGIVLTLFLIPMMLAPVAIGLIWKLLLQGDFGMLTHYLRALGILDLRTALLSDPGLVLPTIMLIDVWQWTPFVTLVLLAGLLSLPREPYEAAVMDGARPWQIFRDITLPMLRPIIALVVLLRAIDAFKEFDKVFILTGGGPGIASELLSIYTYRISFKDWDLGYGAACAFMVYLVVLIMCSVFYKAVFWTEGRTRRRAS